MNKVVDQAGLEEAIDQITKFSVYSVPTGDIIVPNTRCYTKQEVDGKLQDLQDKKLNKTEYDKTLEEVIRVTGFNDIEEFSEDKTYYQGELVKRQEVDENGEFIYRYYRFTQNHAPSAWSANDVEKSSFYKELLYIKNLLKQLL